MRVSKSNFNKNNKILLKNIELKMGCANAKPESHTKKQPLNQNPPTTKPSTLNTSFENPEIKN